MQYYDRRLVPELLVLIAPGGPLGWLVAWSKAEPMSRLDFRRQDSGQKDGALKLYLGRTSPLEVIWMRSGKVKITAHAEYEALTPDLFGNHKPEDLAALEPDLRRHLDACKLRAGASFTKGEAESHNGLMRRYGLEHQAGDPILAIDSELVIGFRADPEAGHINGTAARTAHQAAAKKAVGLPKSQQQPKKLDTIGILPSGDIALVEVKDKDGDIVRAAWQVAMHVHNFTTLMAQEGYDLGEVLKGMLKQKVEVGLIPDGGLDRVNAAPKLIPVIAAPDDDEDGWASKWIADLGKVATPYLDGLRLWRLSEDGVVEQEHP